LSTTDVDFSKTGQTTLYTVPASKVLYLTKAMVWASENLAASTITIGLSTALTNFVNTQTLSNLDAEDDVVIIMPVPNATPVKLHRYNAGDIIKVNVTAAQGSTYSTIGLYGVLIDAP
jgi:acyl CoA:acetate/3-ketoacid CoA transferase beta subunit